MSFGDYERALAEAIATRASSAIGAPVVGIAGSLPADLPPMSVQVIGVGGQVPCPGLRLPGTMIHCRAEGEDRARILADAVDEACRALDSEQVQAYGATVVSIGAESVPYKNPDPSNFNFARFSQQFTLTVKDT